MNVGISLGWNCEAAIRAVELGLRKLKKDGYKTCPFDECITNYEGIVLCLNDDFKYFCDPQYLKIINAPFSTGGIIKGEPLLYNTYYNFIFNHESPGHANLYITQGWPGGKTHYIDNNYKFFIERYQKRICNFRQYLETAEITFIIVTFQDTINDISDKFKVVKLLPNVTMDLYEGHMKLIEYANN
jgi:hypothetical protein